MKLNRILSLVISITLIFGALSGISYAADGFDASAEQAFVVPEEELAATTEETDDAVVYGKEAADFLNALSIAKIDVKTLGEDIKRADFLKLIAIIGGYGTDKTSNQLFADLPLDDEREPYVRALYNLGIISKDYSGNVYPDAAISVQEAVTIAVKITGYSLIAESKGGFPTGYMHIAKNNGILKGIQESALEKVTVGMAAKILENTLKSNIMTQTFGDEGGFTEDKTRNLLGQIFGIYTYQNVVTGVDISRITGENDVNAFFMEIGGHEIEASNIADAHSWLGYNVVAYYTSERGDIPRLLYLEKTVLNEETLINFDDVVSYSNNTIKVSEDNRYKNVTCKNTLPVIYNGVSASDNVGAIIASLISSRNTINEKTGSIKLLDNNADNAVDIVVFDIYDTFVVSYVNFKEHKIYDSYSNSKTITVDDDSDTDYSVVVRADGKIGSSQDIQVGSVIAVYDSAPWTAYQSKKIIKIVKSEISGNITSIKNGGKSVLIDGTEYDVLGKCRTKFSHILTPGTTVKAKLDLNGKIVWLEPGESNFQYGFISAIHTGTGGLSSDLVMKIYTLDSNMYIYGLTDNFIIDGYKYTTQEGALVAERFNEAAKLIDSSSSANSTIVRFTKNSEGKVNCIDTPLKKGATRTTYTAADRAYVDSYAASNDKLFIMKTLTGSKASDRQYFSWNRMLGKSIIVDSAAKVLSHPKLTESSTELQNIKSYATGAYNTLLQNEKQYDGVSEPTTPLAYAIYENASDYNTKLICLNGVTSAMASKSSSDYLYLFDEIYDVYDAEEDKAVKKAKFIGKSGEKVEVLVKEDIINNLASTGTVDIKTLKRGDMVMYSTGSKGELTNIDVFYSPENKTAITAADLNKITTGVLAAPSGSLQIVYGYVYENFLGGAIIYETTEEDFKNSFADGATVTLVGEPMLIKFKDDRCDSPIYAYTNGRGTEKVGEGATADSLRPYKQVGSDCSRVVIYKYSSSPRTVYEIQK